MRKLLLEKIRLTWYLYFLFATFFLIKLQIPKIELGSGALTLFSVNSFLYGFYIGPIMSGQKARIEELTRIIRSEANALFSMLLETQKFSDKTKNELQDLFSHYVREVLRDRRIAQGEPEYEAIISYCLKYDGKDKVQMMQLLDKVVANQQNRTQFNMLMSSRVYSNEWMVMLILFTITVIFILLVNTNGILGLNILSAFLAAALSMLIVVLIKLNTLTHKKAKEIWAPLQKLLATNYYRID